MKLIFAGAATIIRGKVHNNVVASWPKCVDNLKAFISVDTVTWNRWLEIRVRNQTDRRQHFFDLDRAFAGDFWLLRRGLRKSVTNAIVHRLCLMVSRIVTVCLHHVPFKIETKRQQAY